MTTLNDYLTEQGNYTQYLRLLAYLDANDAADTGGMDHIGIVGFYGRKYMIPDDTGVLNFATSLGYAGTDPAEALDLIIAVAAQMQPDAPLDPLSDLFLASFTRETVGPDTTLGEGDTLRTLDGMTLTIQGGEIVDAATGVDDAGITSHQLLTFAEAEFVSYLVTTDSFVLPYDWPLAPAAPEEPAKNYVAGTDSSDKMNTGGADDLVEAFSGADEVRSGGGNDDVYGGGGHDTLRGGAGDDLLIGDTGKDQLRGDGGNDTLMGGTQDDRLDGGSGNDYLDGEAGDDKLVGRDGDDTLRGENGDDKLEGGTGHDSLWGGDGNDQMMGDDGNDTLDGDEGNDQMLGGLGDDLMTGGWGLDELVGDDGADTLNGGYGNDILEGGAGADVFAFGQFAGSDWVMDFEDGVDRVDLSASDIAAFEDLTFEEAGPKVLITAEAVPDFQITLAFVSLAQVDESDFIF